MNLVARLRTDAGDPGLCLQAADEIERLQEAKRRALAIADERSKEACAVRQENERLTAALGSCESWIDRWTNHIGACEGGDKCTCGRTAILYEAHSALAVEQEANGEPK